MSLNWIDLLLCNRVFLRNILKYIYFINPFYVEFVIFLYCYLDSSNLCCDMFLFFLFHLLCEYNCLLVYASQFL